MRYPLAALIGLLGCVDVNGGALELGWKLYRKDGIVCCPDENPCRKSHTDRVLVRLAPTNGGSPIERIFTCEDSLGATKFDLPAGNYSITVQGICGGQSSPIAAGPAPVLREVKIGEVVELGAVALTVDTNDRCCVTAAGSACM